MLVDEEVLGLDVPVEEAILVARIDSLQTLIGHEVELKVSDTALVLGDDLIEIVVHEFEYEEENVFVSDHFLELDDVVVIQSAEGLDLSELHSLVPGVKLFLHDLDGDYLMGGLVATF